MTATVGPSLAGAPPSDVLLAMARLSPSAVLLAEETRGGPRVVWTNPSFDRLAGCRPGALLGKPLSAVGQRMRPLQAETAVRDPLSELVDAGGGTVEVQLLRADGSLSPVRIVTAPLASPEGIHWMLDVREIGTELRAGEELHASEERFRALAVHAPIGIFSSDVGLRFGYVNERCAELWGRSAADLLGTGWLSAVEPDDVEEALAAFSSVLQSGSEIDLPLRVRCVGGEPRWLRVRAVPVRASGRGAGLVGSVEDITADKRHEAELEHQATHDPLTGLPNRTLLWEQLTALIEGRRRDDRRAALLFFDIDNFKLVNDSLGHATGDELLLRLATRMSGDLRGGDILARLGGDEFVVLCAEVSSEQEAMAIAERMLRTVSRPILLGEAELRITASVGVVLVDGDTEAAEALMRDADVAMYQAKGAGKARAALFEERARAEVQERLAIVTDLRRAVERDELDVVFQPIHDLSDGRVVAAEALLRWLHPVRGPIAAHDIVALAEETGAILDVGGWVLRHACEQLRRWRNHLGEDAPRYVTVNVSARQLANDLPDTVEDVLDEYELRGQDLCLELTESVLMADPAGAVATLERLRELGVRLAVDDFGTGYSSLAHLHRLPVQLLKVDRTFVSALADGNSVIVTAVIGLATALGLDVVAEGVERARQAALLREMGCRYAQGFHLGRPMSAAALAEHVVATAARCLDLREQAG